MRLIQPNGHTVPIPARKPLCPRCKTAKKHKDWSYWTGVTAGSAHTSSTRRRSPSVVSRGRFTGSCLGLRINFALVTRIEFERLGEMGSTYGRG